LDTNVTTLHLWSNLSEVTQQSWFYLDNFKENATVSYLITAFSFDQYLQAYKVYFSYTPYMSKSHVYMCVYKNINR